MSETLPLGYSLSVEYQPYSVNGGTVAEINRSFHENKPQHLKDRGFDGLTNWQYQASHNSETCELSKLDVNITYTLPQIQRSEANRDVVDEFKSYMGKLYRHEEMHCAIAAKLFQQVYLAFKQGERAEIANINSLSSTIYMPACNNRVMSSILIPIMVKLNCSLLLLRGSLLRSLPYHVIKVSNKHERVSAK
ncbi:DUF922 domain-containing protein [Vibrio lentus]|nr:DUF922 domain-containing protein [Vibrio lentus]